ncbi:hypothetical protein P5664_12915 [Bacillus subtilis]|uniref:hypothetical protein n=1 Tax=Bacillus subtilis TaxID=1423 RepID=UPI000BA1F2C3|nr:hypothetical protein [Bacillus subtilis]ASU98583.1 hypothetical protein CJZ70_09665 [Bacillus subtilis]MEC2267403.1 hypothetical protein [Bacillus subtilis]UVW11670.1 hypothetical protein NX823_10910 [Bacillus subtilis]WEZ62092.1 hypothetical protein P5657_13765 [Bacillus subtilis]WGD80897.1 hypothetical protein P5659_16890 [Bacillus subtilis]
MNLSNTVKQDVLAELKNGNTEALNGLSPIVAMQYGLALSTDYKEKSPINDEELNKAMLNRLKDSGVKERLIKQMKEEVTGE